MRYWININQVQCLEWKLNVSESIIFSILYDVSNWAESATFEGKTYHFISRNKIQKEIPLLGLKSDTIYRYMKSLKEKELIDHIKIANKDYVRILPKGKKWNSVENPQSGIRSDARKKIRPHSEKNPSEVGKKSESNSEKNPTYTNTNIDTNTNVYPNTKDNPENQVFGSFSDSKKYDSNLSSLEGNQKKEKKDSSQKKEKEVISEVIDHLNDKTGRLLQKNTTAAKQIWHRYKSGATVKEMKRVIDDKVREWKNTSMDRYLHPSTLFRKSNYEKYVEQLPDEKTETILDVFKSTAEKAILDAELELLWDKREENALIGVCKRISSTIKQRGGKGTTPEIKDALGFIIANLPEFYKSVFSFTVIEKNYNQIINQIKNGEKNDGRKGIEEIRRINEGLQEQLGF